MQREIWHIKAQKKEGHMKAEAGVLQPQDKECLKAGGQGSTLLTDFRLPGGPVVRTPCFQCKGHGFDPWSGKFHMTWDAATHTHTHTHTHTQSLKILRESVALPTPCFQTSSLQNYKKTTLYCCIARQWIVIGSICKRTLMHLLPTPHQISTSTLREKNSQWLSLPPLPPHCSSPSSYFTWEEK